MLGMRFLVVAYLDRQANTFCRRVTLRVAHRACMRRLRGAFAEVGPLMNETCDRTGSVFAADVDSRGELEEWLSGHPYRLSGVWESVMIIAAVPSPTGDAPAG